MALADFFGPGFQIFFHLGHELVGYSAIDQAMIVAEREMNDGTDGNGIVAIFIGDDHWLLGDSTDAHDRGVGLIDDRESEHCPELARVGDGEGRAFYIFRLELLGAGAFAKVGDSALQAKEIQISGVLEDGNDQSPVECDGDAHIDVAVVVDVVAFNIGIDDGPLLQSNDCSANEEWHERKTGAMALLEPRLVLRAQVDDPREVHFIHAVNVGAGAAGLDHVLGDQLAHVRHWYEIARIGSRGCRARRRSGGRRLSRCRCGRGSRLRRSLALDELHDVLLGDAAAESGARDLGKADAVLARDLAD
jgi:hypothetical protein